MRTCSLPSAAHCRRSAQADTNGHYRVCAGHVFTVPNVPHRTRDTHQTRDREEDCGAGDDKTAADGHDHEGVGEAEGATGETRNRWNRCQVHRVLIVRQRAQLLEGIHFRVVVVYFLNAHDEDAPHEPDREAEE